MKIEGRAFYVVQVGESITICSTFDEAVREWKADLAQKEDSENTILSIDVTNMEKWNIKEVPWRMIATQLAKGK